MGPLGFQGLDDCARVTEDPSASFRLIAMKGRPWIIALLMTLLCVSAVATGEASRPEGTLTVAVATFGNERWLPHLYVGAEDVVLKPMYENLLSRDPKTGELIPMLAERWQVTDNGRTWKFHLRKGVQFHGGRGELTAEDVKFTFASVARDGSANSLAPEFRLIKSMEVEDPHTITLRFDKPSVVLGNKVSTSSSIASPFSRTRRNGCASCGTRWGPGSTSTFPASPSGPRTPSRGWGRRSETGRSFPATWAFTTGSTWPPGPRANPQEVSP